MRIENFSEIQQDTLVMPQQQNQSSPAVNLRRPQIDMERADEIMRQLEQREQEIIQSQQPVARPRPRPVETVEAPPVEVDTLLLHDTIPVITTLPPQVRTGFSSEARYAGYPPSITLFIVCGLALFAVIKFNFTKNTLEAIQSFFNYRKASLMLEERRESDRQASFLSNLLFILVAGIFISIALPFFGATLPWGSFALSILFFSAASALLYLLKAGMWRLMGVVFMTQTFSKIYVYNMFLYNRNVGLMFFPLVAIIPYVAFEIMPYVVYTVMVAVALSYILKLLRIFQIIRDLNVSVFYFILYLCAFEILPLLLFVKGCKIVWEFNLYL